MRRAFRSGARWFGLPALGLAVGVTLSTWIGGTLATSDRSGSEDRWTTLPTALSTSLEAKAGGYARRAKQFSCLERVRRAEYKNDQATNREARSTYGYLLVDDPRIPGKFRGARTRPEAGETKEVDPGLPYPDPFLWTQLFEPTVRSGLKFKVGEWHTTPYKLVIPIHWASASPVASNQRLTEWSGTIRVEHRTANVISVEAAPNLQDERILAELERYNTAFRILGFSTAAPPIGQEIDVRFDIEYSNYTYPTRVETREFKQIDRKNRETTKKQVVDYEDYRFFRTETKEDIPPLVYEPPTQNEPDAESDSNP